MFLIESSIGRPIDVGACCWLPETSPCISVTPWKSFPGNPCSRSYDTGVDGNAVVCACGD